MKYIFIILFLLNATLCFSQESIYFSNSSTLYTFQNSSIAIFGDIINDSKGGLNHNNGGDVYIFRHTENGVGNSRIYDGPNSTIPIDDYNSNGAFCRFWNLHTDNTSGFSNPSGTLPNIESGSGNIQIEQEVRITNFHYFENGIIWTPRNNWKHAFMHYDSDSSKYFGESNTKHIDGYSSKSGSKNFSFPIGDGKVLRKCGIFDVEDGIFKCAYYNKNVFEGVNNLSGSQIDKSKIDNPQDYIYKVSNKEYWDIDGTNSSKIILSALNSNQGYSDWSTDFNGLNPKSIVIANYNNGWNNSGISDTTNLEFSSNQSFSSRLDCIPDNNISAFTWASSDSSIYSDIDENTNSIPTKYIRMADSKFSESEKVLNFSLGKNGNCLIKVLDLLGREIENSFIYYHEGNNKYFLKNSYGTNNIYFVVLIIEDNDILSLKFIN